MPSVSCGYCRATGFLSAFSGCVMGGKDEKANTVADNSNMEHNIIEGNFMADISATGVYELLICPNKARLSNTGPMVVPNEFTPAAMLSLCAPVDWSPRAIT